MSLARAPIKTSRETMKDRKEDKYAIFLISHLLGTTLSLLRSSLAAGFLNQPRRVVLKEKTSTQFFSFPILAGAPIVSRTS